MFDAGALIALERNDRVLWAALKLAAMRAVDVIVPSTALAQVWRGTPAQARLSKALRHCVIAGFDDHVRAVGELCGRVRTNDVCDAHVAIIASTRGQALYTSDRVDLARLLVAFGGKIPKIISC